MSYENLT